VSHLDGQLKAQTITIGNTASWRRLKGWIAEILAFPGIGQRVLAIFWSLSRRSSLGEVLVVISCTLVKQPLKLTVTSPLTFPLTSTADIPAY
jgi:hypothetical protein